MAGEGVCAVPGWCRGQTLNGPPGRTGPGATAAFQPGPDWTGSDSSSGGASGAGQSWMLEKCQPEPARPGQGLRHGRRVREGQEGQEGFRPGCRAERQVQTGDARAPLAGGEARGAGTRAALPFSDGGTCLPSLRLTACPPASQSRQLRRTDGGTSQSGRAVGPACRGSWRWSPRRGGDDGAGRRETACLHFSVRGGNQGCVGAFMPEPSVNGSWQNV